MALVLADRVKETTTTTGTGTLTLAGASTGFQSFSVVGNGNTTYYAISSSSGSQWEVGIGTYTSSGTTLSRTTILASSNAGSAVNLSAGTKDVFVIYPAGKSVNLDASGNATALGTLASATLTNATGLPISTGVSGLASGIATFLATPSSANLAAALTNETGSGSAVFATSPTLVTPILGTPTSATLTNATGLPLSTGVTGTLPVGNGGTGLTSLTANNVLLGNGTSALQAIAPGTSGNILTSTGTTWASQAASGGGISTANTQSITSNLSLTSSSAGLQVITSDQDGRSVILPSATTLTIGAPKFIINNVGNFQLGVRNYDGTLLASIDASGTAILSLSSIATTAGVWDVDGTALLAGLCVGEVQLGSLGDTASPSSTATAYSFSKISETLAVYFYFNNTTSTGYLRTFDYSTSTFGTELSMTGSPFGQGDTSFAGIYRTSDTSFLVCGYNQSIPGFQLVACTVSSGVITVGSGTDVSDSIANVGLGSNSIVQLSDSLFFIGGSDGSGNFRAKAYTISGTTITSGSLTTYSSYLGNDFTQYYKLSSTSILISGLVGGTAQYYLVATISGTTITYGTQTASTTYQVRNSINTIAAYSVPICVIDDNKFIVGYTDSANSNRPSVVCATVSGTTITFGTGVEVAQINFANTASSTFFESGSTAGYQGYQSIQKISTTAFFINFNSASLQSIISCGTVSGSTITIAPYSIQSLFCANTNTTTADGFGGWIPSNAHKLPNVEIGSYAQLYLKQQFTATNVFNVSLQGVYVENNQPYISKNISYVSSPTISNTNLAIVGVGSLTKSSITSFRFGPYIIIKYGTLGQRTGSALIYKCVGNSIVFLGEIKNTYAASIDVTTLTNTKFATYERSAGFYAAGANTSKTNYFYRFYEVVA